MVGARVVRFADRKRSTLLRGHCECLRWIANSSLTISMSCEVDGDITSVQRRQEEKKSGACVY